FFQAEDGIRDFHVTGVQTCALPICVEAEKLAAALRDDGIDPRRRFRGDRYLDPTKRLQEHGLALLHALAHADLGRRAERLIGGKIGRASCRERGEGARGAESVYNRM